MRFPAWRSSLLSCPTCRWWHMMEAPVSQPWSGMKMDCILDGNKFSRKSRKLRKRVRKNTNTLIVVKQLPPVVSSVHTAFRDKVWYKMSFQKWEEMKQTNVLYGHHSYMVLWGMRSFCCLRNERKSHGEELPSATSPPDNNISPKSHLSTKRMTWQSVFKYVIGRYRRWQTHESNMCTTCTNTCTNCTNYTN